VANGEFTLEGYAETLAALAKIEERLKNEITEEALEAGAEVVKDFMRDEAPVSELQKKHARDNLIIKRTNLKGKITIGTNKDSYYLQFPEFGTSSIPAEPFAERALKLSELQTKKVMANVIKRRLKQL
jgi:HK97 gp10 family phage protein